MEISYGTCKAGAHKHTNMPESIAGFHISIFI